MQVVIYLRIRECYGCGQVIENSGIANYILMDEDVHSAQDVIDKMIPITEYVKLHPNIYFCL